MGVHRSFFADVGLAVVAKNKWLFLAGALLLCMSNCPIVTVILVADVD